MKTKKELEELFDKQVTCMRIFDEYWKELTIEVNKFIFDTIIPEVVRSMDPDLYTREDYNYHLIYQKKAKELYNIDL